MSLIRKDAATRVARVVSVLTEPYRGDVSLYEAAKMGEMVARLLEKVTEDKCNVRDGLHLP